MKRKLALVLTLVMVLAAFSGCSSKTQGTLTQLDPPKVGDKVAIIQTSKGDIKVKLLEKEAPKAVENFIGLAQKKYYDGIIFHRVINDFMVQGGDPTGTGMGGESLWGAPFKDEFSKNARNFRGALSMANSGKNTNGSQFFIVQSTKVNQLSLSSSGATDEVKKTYESMGGTPNLDDVHTVFGQVFEGMDVVDAIASAKTDAGDKPLEAITINTVIIETVK